MSATHRFTDAELNGYRDDGFALVRRLFAGDEIGRLGNFAHNDPALVQQSYDRADTQGRATKLALWNDPPPEPYRLFTCSARVIERIEQLLGEEVYHWHSKMTMKEPKQGGAWEWHQDYGYWYHNFCLFPRLISCMIAVDDSTRENGCLRVLRGSHQMGRIEHGQSGEQTGADGERVAEALERLDCVNVEMQAGDALFFDCNLLHRSEPNLSTKPRWTLIGCYNAASNSPYQPTRHPFYTPLERSHDDDLRRWCQQGADTALEADSSMAQGDLSV